jgi:hypothetical protein
MMRGLSRDRLAVLAGLVVPVALAAVLVPFRSSIPNTDAALAMILVVVAVAANGYRLAGVLAAEGFPASCDTELLVESGGMFQGRFLMAPAPEARPTPEQRLLAVALADQVGAALATSHPVDQS